MKEIFSMWKSTKMVVLVALTAAIYAAVLIPFKAIVLIPGVTELRPASAFPVVFGILFGPAGAWGAAIGNLIGDFFGSLGLGSIFGFIGNFMFAYTAYVIWHYIGDNVPKLDSGFKYVKYIIAGLGGSLACALIIGYGLDLMGMVPYAALGTIIALNNSIPTIILGIPLLMVLYPRIKKWNLLWTDIIPEEVPEPTVKRKLIATIFAVVVIGGFIICLGSALFGGQEMFQWGSASGNLNVKIMGSATVVSMLILLGLL